MTGMKTMLPMIKMIPTFDGRNYVEWTRLFNDILQIILPFLSKIVSGLERPEPIPRESREGGEENASDIDDNDSNPSEVSATGSRNLDEEPSNSDDIEVWDTANQHLSSSVLWLTTTGNSMFVRLGTDYEIRNGGYFESIKNSANQFISKP